MRIGFLSHLDLNLYLFRLPVMRELSAQGHDVYAICPKGDYFDRFASAGVRAIAYDIDRNSLNPFLELKTIRNIYHTVQPLELDILHNFTVKPNIYGSIAGHLAKVPVIVNSVTGLGSFYIHQTSKARLVRKVIERLYKMANKRTKAVLFQNSDDRTYFIDHQLVDSDKAMLIKGSGIDTDYFSPSVELSAKADKLKGKLGLEGQHIVMMVARAIWDKGVKEFYEAALQNKNEQVSFVYIGDTDSGNPSCADEEYLRNGNVVWLGHRDDILELTAMADIYVLPSYREGLPRTLLEASAMKKPIITTDTVGCKEVVEDGYNGFLIPIKDANALANKITYLIEHPDTAREFAKNSRKRAIKAFDVKIIVKQYLMLYRQLTSQIN